MISYQFYIPPMVSDEENQPSFVLSLNGGTSAHGVVSAKLCGGQLIAKVNEVDTLFSPGELILLALLHCYVVGGVTHNLKFLGDSFVVVKPYSRRDRY